MEGLLKVGNYVRENSVFDQYSVLLLLSRSLKLIIILFFNRFHGME